MPTMTIQDIRPDREGLVTHAIAGLSAEQKTVLGLWYLEELKLAEIADLLGITSERVVEVLEDALARVRAVA